MKIHYLYLSLLSLIAVSCKTHSSKSENNTRTITIHLEEKNQSGVKATATFTQKDNIVYLHFEGSGFTPGKHAIHIHEKADCSSDNGTSAGGHWNPTFENHGKWGSKTFHRGDIGNFIADENGNASLDFETDLWCIDCDDDTKNIINKALIIHQGEDDFTSQPSGNAGKRISCGAIIR